MANVRTWSVVMPYFGNERTLVRSLQSFAGQSLQPAEIIVVDDGAKVPAAAVFAASALQSVPVRMLRADHAGQSAATNVGIAAATGTLTYLTCPDIVAPRHTLALHDAAHAQAEAKGASVGVMGHIRYAPWVQMTPFMRFLSRPGPQFCYDRIGDPENAPPEHLYAPACSVPTQSLQAVGGFDAQFTYGYQDTDLGLRLAAAGLRFLYRAAAQVLHDHPNTLAAFCRRQHRVATMAWHLMAKHPQVLERECLANGLVSWAKAMDRVPQLVAEIAAREAQLASAPRGERAALTTLLDQRYAWTLEAAFTRGLFAGGERTRQALQLSRVAWQEVEAAIEAAPWPFASKAAERLNKVDVHRHRAAPTRGVAAAP